MTSGLHFPEWTDWNYMIQPMTETKDWNQFVLSQTMDSRPGEIWNYNTGGSQLMAAILRKNDWAIRTRFCQGASVGSSRN
ncbi:hypothetical protein ACFTAO_47405 [Paenibacillus rhizoplanae]